MKKISFYLTGAALCGLVTAVLYLAYAQEAPDNQQVATNVVQAEDGEEDNAVIQEPASKSNGKATSQGGQVASANGKAANGKNGNGNGKTIDLQVGGDQTTNAFGGETLEGVNTNLISIALDAVSVQDVVNMFAQISGANIITAGTFTNLFVTANLKNVEWKSALSLALGSVNLSIIEDPSSGILMVVTTDMYRQKLQQIEETKPLVTKMFTPKYLKSVDLIEQIKLLKMLSPRGTIVTSQSKDQDKANLKSSGNIADASGASIQNPSITTAIIVSDIKEYVEKIEALINRLDQREPQVFIEARIIDVGITYNQKLGFDWSMLDKFGGSISLKDAQWKYSDARDEISKTDSRDNQWDKRSNKDDLNKRSDIHGQQYEESTTTYEESPPGSGNWVAKTIITPTREIIDTIDRGRDITLDKSDLITDTYGEAKMGTMILSASDVALYLSALRNTGHADVLSHPVLIVGNRVEAKIHVGEQTWRISLKRDTTNTGSAPMDRYSEDAAPMDLGLKLWVIPEIDVANDTVRMTIEPEMTVFIRNITTAQGSVYPVTSTRRISTRVSIPNAQTVVIGGLVDNKKSKNEKKVPLLGDIPLLGYLFTHTEDVDEKHNLLIMLSPTILDERKPVTGMEAIAQLTVNKFEQTPLAPIPNVPTNQVFVPGMTTNHAASASSNTIASASSAANPSAAVNGRKSGN
jgi:type II secretory pathway component GspD/PulD (secretin)